MDKQQQIQNQNKFQLDDVILLKESFVRPLKLSFGEGVLETDIDFDFKHTKANRNKQFTITIAANIIGKQVVESKEDQEIFKAEITYVGVFSIDGTPELSFENFCKVNGPAIIFPFIREHIASVTAKAGLPKLLLPTLNFKKIG